MLGDVRHAGTVRRALGRVDAVGGITILELAAKLGEALGVEVEPHVTGESRSGDARHCFTDVTLAGELPGYAPAISLERGLADLAEGLDGAPGTPARRRRAVRAVP